MPGSRGKKPKESSNQPCESDEPAGAQFDLAALIGKRIAAFSEQIISSLDVGIIAYDADLRYMLWNPFMAKLTGVPADVVLGKPVLENYPFQREEGVRDLLERALAGETIVQPYARRFLAQTAESGFFSCQYGPIRDESGEILGVIGIIKRGDKAADALRESEERFRTLCENARDVIYTLAADGTITTLNPAFEKITGWPAADWIGKHFLPLVHPDDTCLAMECNLRVLMGEEPESVELKILDSNGNYVVGEFKSTPRFQDGRVIGALGIVRDITERKRAETSIRDSRQQYENLIDNLDGIVWESDARTLQFSFVSKQAERILGYPIDRWTTEPSFWREHVHPNDLERAVGVRAAATADLRSNDFSYRMIASDGRTVWFRDFVSVVVENGQPLKLRGVMIDVTERMLAEESLVNKEEQLRTVVANVPIVLLACDRDGIITLSEGKGLEKLGRGAGDAVGLSIYDVYRDYPQIMTSCRRALAGESVAGILRLGDMVFDATYLPMRDHRGEIVGAIGVATDVTERGRAERALLAAEQKYRSIFENAVEGIFQSTPEGRFITVNPALVRMFGFATAEELIRSVDSIDNHLYTDPVTRVEYKRMMQEHGEVRGFESQAYRKDRTTIWISESGRAVLNSEGQVVCYEGTIEDITERKNAEAERARLEEQLLQSHKMESIGRLAGGVAHDFNNLLTAIIGFAQLVYEKLEGSPVQEEVAEIMQAGSRAAELTSQLLAFGRRQTLVRKPADLNETIGNLMRMLRRIIREDVDLRFNADATFPVVYADVGQIEQVVMNLIVNARDAMPRGGRVVIETHNVTLDELYCRDHLDARPGNYVQVVVSDTGAGMDAETQRLVFEPFFTTKDEGKGTGLGLAVVYGIVNQHDGWIRVYSEPDRGTTFRLYLPMYDQSTRGASDQTREQVRGGCETILVAEDEGVLRDLARSVLEELGYEVLLASDGEEALRIFEENRDRIDLVIADMVMPQKGGREACEKIRENASDVPVIFVTGYSPEIVGRDLAFEFGATLLQKPYTVGDLSRKVREVLDGRGRRTAHERK